MGKIDKENTDNFGQFFLKGISNMKSKKEGGYGIKYWILMSR
jgi:hypothetical protein